jgi:hypothetical protein
VGESSREARLSNQKIADRHEAVVARSTLAPIGADLLARDSVATRHALTIWQFELPSPAAMSVSLQNASLAI